MICMENCIYLEGWKYFLNPFLFVSSIYINARMHNKTLGFFWGLPLDSSGVCHVCIRCLVSLSHSHVLQLLSIDRSHRRRGDTFSALMWSWCIHLGTNHLNSHLLLWSVGPSGRSNSTLLLMSPWHKHSDNSYATTNNDDYNSAAERLRLYHMSSSRPVFKALFNVLN